MYIQLARGGNANTFLCQPAAEAAAAEKRDRVIQAAARFLREEESIVAFSLDAVAKAAEVTRLTTTISSAHGAGCLRRSLTTSRDEVGSISSTTP